MMTKVMLLKYKLVQVFEVINTKLQDKHFLELRKFANQDIEYQQLSRYLSHGHSQFLTAVCRPKRDFYTHN